MSDLEEIDFATFLDEDDDMEVEDGQPMSEDLRDAFDLVRTDGFDPVASHGTDSNSSMDVQSGANTNNGSTQSTSTGFAARSIGAPGELTRSSSQMDMITAERNNAATERWEEDEPMGERATKAAVLYVNINFPRLKEKVPEWSERVKHIQKLWRTLSSDSRKQYVEKARENRQLRGKIPRQRKVHATQMTSIDSVTSNTGQSMDGSSGTTVEHLQQIPPQTHQPLHQLGTPSQQGMQSLPHYHQQMAMSQGNFPGMQKIPDMQSSEPVGRMAIRPEIMHHYLMMRDRIVAIENQQNYLEDELGKMKKQKRLLAMKSKKLNRDSESSSAQTPGIPPHSTQFSDLNPGMGSPEREIEMNATIDLNQEEKLQLDQLSNAIPIKQKDIEKTKQEMKIQMQAMNEYLSRQGLSREIIESNFQMQQNMGIQRGHPPRPPPHLRSPYLAGGKCVYSQISLQEDRSIYECVDDLLFQVTSMCEAPPQNMLKRLLEHKPAGQIGASMMGQSGGVPSASGMVPGIGCGPSSLAHFTNESLLEPTKAKKKRTQVKKTGISSGNNEIDTMIERINCQLRMSEQFSRRALESVQSKGSGHVLEPGLTELPDRLKDQTTSALTTQGNKTNPSPIEGEHFGQTNFTFMDDILQVDESSIRKLINASGPSMAAFAPAANLQALANAIPTPCELEFDELDLLEGASRWDLMRTLVRAIPRRPIDAFLRTSIRQFDGSLPPLEQVRNAFFKTESEDEEVEICIDVNEAELLKWAEKYKHTGVAQAGQELFDQFAKILNNGQKVEYAIDTPPLSPVYSNDGNLQPSVEKQEPFAGNFAGAEKCRACSTYMQAPVCTQNFSRLGLSPASDDGVDESASFCSMRCYYSFVATKKLPLSPDQLSEAERHVDEETISRLKQISADSFAKIVQGKVKMEQTAAAPILSDSLRLSSRESRCSIDEGKKEYSQIFKASELPNINDPDGTNRSIAKKEVEDKGWAIFSAQVHDTFVRVQQFKKQLAIHQNKMGVMNMVFPTNDNRKCKLCDVVGDAETATQGRLLNFDIDQWVHVNCALWSAEVFETPSTGALSHVQKAVERAQQVMCHRCGRLGASMQCHKADCQSSFHLPCAKEIAGSKFLKDRTFICSRHHEVTNEVVLTGLEAVRRLYIDRDENALLGKLFEVETKRMVLKLGSFTLHSIGQLLPEHLKAFHNNDYIYPVGFRASRFFYFPPTSTVDFSSVLYRMEYICQILEKDKKPWFDVQLRYVANDNQLVEKSVGSGPTATIAWQPALTYIKNARDRFSQLAQQSKPSVQYLRFFPNALTGEGLFGLKENAITKITESLPGVDTLYTYSFRHGGAPILEMPLAENPSGCARTEPRCRTLIKKHRSRPSVSAQTAESTSSSSSTSMSISGRRRTSARSGSTYDQELAAAEFQKMLTASGVGAEWAAAMKFSEPQTNASIYTAYQKMKKDWQNTVYLARSKIQGLGLYAKVDIDMHAMIIEYKGELIRSEICEVREKRYTDQNRGVYMFRIDEENVIDATMAGGCARYINHSCDPNCSTRIIQAGSTAEDKKIIITANRPIKAHEELTYDYQFELEEETKISCLCGAPNCQKWMN